MSNLYIPNKETFNEKLQKIKADSLPKLHIVSDFDKTLTGQAPEGKLPSTSWSIFKQELGEEYAVKRKALFDQYYPIEINNSLDFNYRSKQLAIWWQKHFDLLKEYKVTIKTIEKVLKDEHLKIRNGVLELFKIASENKIPFLIFSAGIGDTIDIYLKQLNLKTNNIHILSNFFDFDSDGVVSGFKRQIVHTLNKTESLVKNEPYFKEIIDRPNCILLGDSLHDANMVNGIDHSTIIKIGFLNGKMEDRTDFEKVYDVIIENDTDISELNSLLLKN